ncbi:MAG: SRPBCC domain-containing protein, partial [Thermomicrobiales bacterium]|nr:SRPBCC domain-containing protein [Thermomicrobiales bacterium]
MATIDFIDDDDDRPAVRVARSFDAPADRLWNAVSDPAEFVNWFPAEVTFEPVPGALIQFDQDGEKTSGEVLAFEAPRRFAFTWNGDAFDLSVTPEGQTSHLTLLHRFDDRAGAASFATGWEACLEWLDSSLTAGEPPAPGPRKARHEELVAEFGLDRPVIA